MEFIVISDVYGDEEVLDQLTYQLEGDDRIILVAGDIGIYQKWANDLKRYHKRVTKVLEKLLSFSQVVYFVPSGTDSETLENEKEEIINVDKKFKIIDGKFKIAILGLGGAILVVAEGILQKVPKLLRHVENLDPAVPRSVARG